MSDCHNVSGMSIRDWFAGMAMQGMVERSVQINQYGFKDQETSVKAIICQSAYLVADAMLAEREKEK